MAFQFMACRWCAFFCFYFLRYLRWRFGFSFQLVFRQEPSVRNLTAKLLTLLLASATGIVRICEIAWTGTGTSGGELLPRGESAAGLRFRAYQAEDGDAGSARGWRTRSQHPQVRCPPHTHPSRAWVGHPLFLRALRCGCRLGRRRSPPTHRKWIQDYNWVSGRATSVLVDPPTPGNTILLGGAYGGFGNRQMPGSKNSYSELGDMASADRRPAFTRGGRDCAATWKQQPYSGWNGRNQLLGRFLLRHGNSALNGWRGDWTQITSAASGQSFVGVGFSKMAFSIRNTNLVVASTAGDIGLDFGLEQDANSTARGLYYSKSRGDLESCDSLG